MQAQDLIVGYTFVISLAPGANLSRLVLKPLKLCLFLCRYVGVEVEAREDLFPNVAQPDVVDRVNGCDVKADVQMPALYALTRVVMK